MEVVARMSDRHKTNCAYSVKVEEGRLLDDSELVSLYEKYRETYLSGGTAMMILEPQVATQLSNAFSFVSPDFLSTMNVEYAPISGDWAVMLSSCCNEDYMMFLTNRPDTIEGMKEWDGQLSSLVKDKDVIIVPYTLVGGKPIFDRKRVRRLCHMKWCKRRELSKRTESADRYTGLSDLYDKGFFNPQTELSVSVNLDNMVEQYQRSVVEAK